MKALALTAVNARGIGKVWFASQGVNRQWAIKREHLSPAYSTRWKDLPIVR